MLSDWIHLTERAFYLKYWHIMLPISLFILFAVILFEWFTRRK